MFDLGEPSEASGKMAAMLDLELNGGFGLDSQQS